MILDIYTFDYNNKFFFYDVQSGEIVPLSELQYNILSYFDLSAKDIVKKLSDKYSIGDILKDISYIRNLENNEVLHHKITKHITFDHSNLVSLDYVYYKELTPLVGKTYKKILDRYYEESIDLRRIDIQEKPSLLNEDINNSTNTIEPFASVEIFLRKWDEQCYFALSPSEFDFFMGKAMELDKDLSIFIGYLYKKENFKDIQNILRYIKSIYNKEKKILPCSAATKNLFIDDTGEIYNCYHSVPSGNSKKVDQIGIINSVYDSEPCMECSLRFICGGYCSYKKDDKLNACPIFKKIISVFLKYCAYIQETDSSHKKVLLDEE